MARDSDVVRVAKISARTQLQSQALGLVTDPLWSSVLGFVAVHELHKHNMIGPVSESVLYAGIIAINTARQPGVASAVGSALGVDGLGGLVAGGVAGAAAGGISGGAAAGGAAAGGAAAGGGIAGVLPAAGALALAAGGTYAGLTLTEPKNPMWKQILGYAAGGPITQVYRATQRLAGRWPWSKKKKK